MLNLSLLNLTDDKCFLLLFLLLLFNFGFTDLSYLKY
jgi:hypothetical protein